MTRLNKNIHAKHTISPNEKEVAELQTIMKSLDTSDAHVNRSPSFPRTSLSNDTHVNRSPNFPRTSLQWVVDKPNNNETNHVSKQQVQTEISTQNLRQPKIPVDRTNDLRLSMQRNPKLYDPSMHGHALPNKISMNPTFQNRNQQNFKCNIYFKI